MNLCFICCTWLSTAKVFVVERLPCYKYIPPTLPLVNFAKHDPRVCQITPIFLQNCFQLCRNCWNSTQYLIDVLCWPQVTVYFQIHIILSKSRRRRDFASSLVPKSHLSQSYRNQSFQKIITGLIVAKIDLNDIYSNGCLGIQEHITMTIISRLKWFYSVNCIEIQLLQFRCHLRLGEINNTRRPEQHRSIFCLKIMKAY